MRYIVINKSLSAHCCFESTVVDTLGGKESFGDYWKKPVCECFDPTDAELIADALNATEKVMGAV